MESLVIKSHFVVVLLEKPSMSFYISCLQLFKAYKNNKSLANKSPGSSKTYTISLFCLRKQNSVASVFIVGPQFPKHAFKISIKI